MTTVDTLVLYSELRMAQMETLQGSPAKDYLDRAESLVLAFRRELAAIDALLLEEKVSQARYRVQVLNGKWRDD